MSEINILITGASGFVGSHALPIFKKKYNVDTNSLKGRNPEDFELNKYEVILHLSGIAHQTKQISPVEYESVNHKLPVQFAKRAKEQGVGHFIFISTVKVYGENADKALKENSACTPVDPYGQSKLNAEKDLLAMNSDSFIVSVIRPALIYGKGVKGNLAKLVNLIRAVPVIPFPLIHNKRSLVYVENLVAMVDRIMEKKMPGVFLACDINNISTSQIISAFATQLKKKSVFIPIPAFTKNLIRRFFPYKYDRLFGSFVVDSSFSNQKLDFSPPYTFDEGIKRMFE
jgi:UDP-glucose 4-epimerase